MTNNYYAVKYKLFAIKDGEHRLALILAGDDIYAVEGDELRLFALDDNIIALTPMEQTAEPVEHGVLGLCASLAGKAVLCVARETAGEILAHITVGYSLCSVHQNFCTIIKLRSAVDSEQ